MGCSLSAKVSFSPPLKSSSGGTNHSKIKGTLSHCFTTTGAVTLTSAKATGYFASSPITCASTVTNSSPSLTIKWKGDYNGSVGETTYGGKATFSPSQISGGTATGSFPGNVTVDLNSLPNVTASCQSSRGIKSLTLTGSVLLGVTAGGGGGGGGDTTSINGVATQLASDQQGYCSLLLTGGIECWGDNNDGELGNGTSTRLDCYPASCTNAPVAVTGITNATSVASSSVFDAGWFNSYCAVLSTGGIECWGDNTWGELGDGGGFGSDTPVPVSGITNATSLASDGYGYCAVLTSGGIDCWGFNEQGDLGNGDLSDSNVPVAVSGITNAANLMSDGAGYCAILTSGGVECWGDNTYGELGNGGSDSSDCSDHPLSLDCSDVPVAVSGITNAASLASDGLFSPAGYCAVLTSGGVECWGDGGGGELGNGDLSDSNVPVAVTGITDAASLASDQNGYCAVLTSGGIECWGDNTDGQLGDGGVDSADCSGFIGCSDVPMAVSGITDAASITSDEHYLDLTDSYCAILTSGDVVCWGSNFEGELGAGNGSGPDTCYDGESCSQVPVQTPYPPATSLASDGEGYCSILTTGGVECWGSNSVGQLGVPSPTTTTAPPGTPALSVAPNTGLTNGQSVLVTATSSWPGEYASLVECNNALNEPTVFLGGVVDAAVGVGCTGVGYAQIVQTGANESLSVHDTVTTGTIGPPCGPSYFVSVCPPTDSAGNNPAADAALYPCPPTPAQQAAGVTCSLQFGDETGDLVNATILFAGE